MQPGEGVRLRDLVVVWIGAAEKLGIDLGISDRLFC